MLGNITVDACANKNYDKQENELSKKGSGDCKNDQIVFEKVFTPHGKWEMNWQISNLESFNYR